MTTSRVSPVKRIIILIAAILGLLGGFFITFYDVGKGINSTATGIDVLKHISDVIEMAGEAPTEMILTLFWPVVIGLTGLVMLIHFFLFKKGMRVFSFVFSYLSLIFSIFVFYAMNSELAQQDASIFNFVSIGFYVGVIGQILAVVGVTMKR